MPKRFFIDSVTPPPSRAPSSCRARPRRRVGVGAVHVEVGEEPAAVGTASRAYCEKEPRFRVFSNSTRRWPAASGRHPPRPRRPPGGERRPRTRRTGSAGAVLRQDRASASACRRGDVRLARRAAGDARMGQPVKLTFTATSSRDERADPPRRSRACASPPRPRRRTSARVSATTPLPDEAARPGWGRRRRRATRSRAARATARGAVAARPGTGDGCRGGPSLRLLGRRERLAEHRRPPQAALLGRVKPQSSIRWPQSTSKHHAAQEMPLFSM